MSRRAEKAKRRREKRRRKAEAEAERYARRLQERAKNLAAERAILRAAGYPLDEWWNDMLDAWKKEHQP